MLDRGSGWMSAVILLIPLAAKCQTMAMPEAKGPETKQAAPPAGAQATAPANTWPAADGTVVLPDFKFGTGETLPELKLHFLTLGTPHRDSAGHTDNAILLLHGTGGSAHSLLAPQFSTVLFGPGQPLDIEKYFLIFPDDIGHGQSSKPSDGLHMHFPAYDYDDMVAASSDDPRGAAGRPPAPDSRHFDGLHADLRLGGNLSAFSDALMALACLPVEIAGRNRMMRHMAIEAIKQDPQWNGGEYTEQPKLGLRNANELVLVMGYSPLQLQKNYPTRLAAEQRVDATSRARLPRPTPTISSITSTRAAITIPARSWRITAPLLWINSADDFINPPELGSPNDGEPHAARPIRADPDLRRDARPRHAHRGRRLEGLSGRADAGVGPETLMERPERFPAARICPHSAPILEVRCSLRRGFTGIEVLGWI